MRAHKTFEIRGCEVSVWIELFEPTMAGGTMCKAGASWGNAL